MTEPKLSSYPIAMATALRSQWNAANWPAELLPSPAVLELLLDTMYQASLLREELSQIRCRVIVAKPEEFQRELSDGTSDLHVLRFEDEVEFTPHNLRKLAAAAGAFRALLGTSCCDETGVSIWGLVITGTEWVNRVEGARLYGAALPANPLIQILGPGHLVASSGYTRVVESRGGKLLTNGFDPFRSNWLHQRFSSVRESIVRELQPEVLSDSQPRLCKSFVKDVAQSIVRRALRLVRTRGHGGILIFFPNSDDGFDTCLKSLRFRVRFHEDDSVFRFRRLLTRLISRALEVAKPLGLETVTWDAYQNMQDAELSQFDDALVELGHFLADLMSVDGALALDRSFRLIGFGAEILGDSHVLQIHRALDLEADQTVLEPADWRGTRHRSAYRLVSGQPEVVAIVISQDGEVKFVAHHNEKLTYWDYLP